MAGGSRRLVEAESRLTRTIPDGARKNRDVAEMIGAEIQTQEGKIFRLGFAGKDSSLWTNEVRK
ncbi:MAG: hypothetical protein NVSMB9_04640 [Isosphaeraceae bacterium]